MYFKVVSSATVRVQRPVFAYVVGIPSLQEVLCSWELKKLI
ncbi:unnamed protein product [Brassica oleracea]